MPILQSVGLMLFVVLLAAFLVRYVHMTVDREFRNLARAVSDADYRGDELARVDRLLDGMTPPPPDARPAPPPGPAWIRFAAPVLFFLGVALLWGGAFARRDRGLWLGGAAVCCLASGLAMLVTLRRRKWERLARLLRFRADLRRLDGDRPGAAADLRDLLRLTPWDDAAWAELSDDLAAAGRLDEALDAARQAARLDPRYDEYRMFEASIALRLGRPDLAREAVREWAAIEGTDAKDPRLAIYRAAADLAGGRREAAAMAMAEAAGADSSLPLDIIDADAALEGVKVLLPPAGGAEDGER